MVYEFSIVCIKLVKDVIESADEVVYRTFEDDSEKVLLIEGYVSAEDIGDLEEVLDIINNSEDGAIYIVEIMYIEYSGGFDGFEGFEGFEGAGEDEVKLSVILNNWDELIENGLVVEVEDRGIFVMKIGAEGHEGSGESVENGKG